MLKNLSSSVKFLFRIVKQQFNVIWRTGTTFELSKNVFENVSQILRQ